MRKCRFFLIFLTIATTLSFGSAISTAHAQRSRRPNRGKVERINLSENSSTSELVRVTTQLVGAGHAMPAVDQKVPLRLKASFQYDERVIARQKTLKSIRTYAAANAEIQLDNKTSNSRLDASHHLILNQAPVQGTQAGLSIASIGSPLTQEELELIDTPANSLVAAQLVVKNQVAVGDTWAPTDRALARFLNLDIVTENAVKLTLEKIQRSVAIIHCEGKIVGYIDDTKTEIELEGTIQFDIKRGRLRGLLVTLNQQRSVGQISPGLDAIFKIKSVFESITTSPRLSNKALERLRDSTSVATHLKLISADRTFSLEHPRDWRVISNRSERTVLRYLRDGEMFGQCDIIALPSLAANQPHTLAQFKKAVETNLTNRHGVIVDGDQSVTPSGLEWLRVDAAGSVDGITLHWNYYVLTDPAGRRLQVIFTTEPVHSGKFVGHDQALLEQISFLHASPSISSTKKTIPAQQARFAK